MLAAATGVKPSLIDPVAKHKSDLYEQRNALQQQLSVLGQRGIKGENANQQRIELNKKVRELNTQIYNLSLKHGDKLPASGAPSSKGGSGWGAPASKKSGWGAPKSSKSGWG